MPAVTESATPGLRERKRLATRRAIQLATLELLDEGGIDGVTVDEISRRADISPRTFFNYFSSKEQALLGEPLAMPSDETVEAFVAATGPILDDLADLLTLASDPVLADAEVVRLRHRVLKNEPHLLGIRIASMRRFEEELGELVGRRLQRADPSLPAATVVHQARLITLFAVAGMRHAWISWASTDSTEQRGPSLHAAFAEARKLLATGVSDIR